MKHLIPILTLCLCFGCATRKPIKSEPAAVDPGTVLSRKSMPTVRTPETVKAYPVGRYTDPNFPDEMHERHTVYRREQSPDWNYLPDPPYALPLGPTVTNSNPSPSYYVRAEGEINAQQRAYAEALQEQNRAMKKRIASLQRDAGKLPELEQEIDRLKKQLDTLPIQQPPAEPSRPEPAETSPEMDDFFSTVDPPLPVWDAFPDSTEINCFARMENGCQAFLIAQMQQNDELAAALENAERNRFTALFHAAFLRRKELAHLTKYTP